MSTVPPDAAATGAVAGFAELVPKRCQVVTPSETATDAITSAVKMSAAREA
jgi:hypothetical protein